MTNDRGTLGSARAVWPAGRTSFAPEVLHISFSIFRGAATAKVAKRRITKVENGIERVVRNRGIMY